jgi:glyoxylase-like metal-dependent hydrolase (beta-lactamase superfamily II)
LPDRNVIFAGDTLVVDTHPIISNRTSAAWLNTLAELRQLAKKNTILTGRGPVLYAGSDETLHAIDAVENYIRDMRARIGAHVEAGRAREAIVTYIPEFFGRFSLQTLPADWVRQQIKLSLGNIYDEVQSIPEEDDNVVMA